MSGLTNLDQLIAGLSPVLNPGEWVFVSVADAETARSLEPICIFVEAEGVTAICLRDQAVQANLPNEEVFSHITLDVHSSLNAVGLIAAVADVLSQSGIPCNVVSAVHHDHLFVPIKRAKDAQALLKRMSAARKL